MPPDRLVIVCEADGSVVDLADVLPGILAGVPLCAHRPPAPPEPGPAVSPGELRQALGDVPDAGPARFTAEGGIRKRKRK